MARRKRITKPLETIWECPDDLWDNVIGPVLDALDPPKITGRKRIDPRQALNGIIYQLRSGCQWNHLPRDFGDDASIHRTFQRWIAKGVLLEICCTEVELSPLSRNRNVTHCRSAYTGQNG